MKTFWVNDPGQPWSNAMRVEVEDDEDEASAVEVLVGEDFWQEVAVSDACEGVYMVAPTDDGIGAKTIRLRWMLVREAEEIEDVGSKRLGGRP